MDDYTIACYYFPNYHPSDKRNEAYHGHGWSEWEVVKKAPVRFEGHAQPKAPLWGYTDESDPNAMAQKIDAAADSGIDAFIFDWYWYDDGPFLEQGLDAGFLKAPNNDRMRFALMWANHDWLDMHPRKAGVTPPVLYPGKVTAETFDAMTDHTIETYFRHPSHWLIDGAPYFSIYEVWKLVETFGSLEGTAAALKTFRSKTKRAGFRDLHLNAVFWGRAVLPGEQAIEHPETVLPQLGFDSVTSYVWVHHVPLDQRPYTPYLDVLAKYLDYARAAATRFAIPYYPNVTMGWDASPREDEVRWGNIMGGNTPESFRTALEEMKAFVDQTSKGHRIITVNAWNEWTEGSYLEPDAVHGMAYLDAVRAVFGPGKR